jgi:MFS family permease
VLADRVSRRGILLVADLVRLAVVATLGVALLDGHASPLLLIACVVPLGAASGSAAPAFGAILPDIVEAPDLVRANSVMGGVTPFAQMMIGPVLGGVLASVDVGLAMFVDATFAVSAGCVLFLRPAGPRRPVRAAPAAVGGLREGLAYVRRTPWRGQLAVRGRDLMAVSGSFTILPLLVTRDTAPSEARLPAGSGGAVATLTAVVVGMLRRGARWRRRT